MANTYTRIYVQIVFAVQGRQNLIRPDHKEELQMYISGIIRNKGQKVIAINSMPDHTHILIGMRPTTALSDIVRDIKNNSSSFINSNGWIRGTFRWQEGYGAFSYAHSQLERVVTYIKNQERHHKRRTFGEEYIEMLKRFNVEYNARYLFDWIEHQSASLNQTYHS